MTSHHSTPATFQAAPPDEQRWAGPLSDDQIDAILGAVSAASGFGHLVGLAGQPNSDIRRTIRAAVRAAVELPCVPSGAQAYVPAANKDFGDPRRAMDEAELQEFCIALSFEQDDYTIEVIRAVEDRLLAKPLFVPSAIPPENLGDELILQMVEGAGIPVENPVAALALVRLGHCHAPTEKVQAEASNGDLLKTFLNEASKAGITHLKVDLPDQPIGDVLR